MIAPIEHAAQVHRGCLPLVQKTRDLIQKQASFLSEVHDQSEDHDGGSTDFSPYLVIATGSVDASACSDKCVRGQVLLTALTVEFCCSTAPSLLGESASTWTVKDRLEVTVAELLVELVESEGNSSVWRSWLMRKVSESTSILCGASK